MKTAILSSSEVNRIIREPFHRGKREPTGSSRWSDRGNEDGLFHQPFDKGLGNLSPHPFFDRCGLMKHQMPCPARCFKHLVRKSSRFDEGRTWKMPICDIENYKEGSAGALGNSSHMAANFFRDFVIIQ